MGSRMLLVDFDGVVLRNNRCVRYQCDQSAKFVQKVTGMSLRASEQMNRQWYPRHGHTVTMLNNMFDNVTTLEEYNSFVFDRQTMAAEIHDADFDVQTHEQFGNIMNLIDKCNKADISTAIFTNACLSWVSYCTMKVAPRLLQKVQVIYPTRMNQMKPNYLAYDNVELLFPNKEEFWFVDDTKAHLLEPSKRDNWIPFYYTPNTTVRDMQDHFGLV